MITLYVIGLIMFFLSYRFLRKNNWNFDTFSESKTLSIIGLILGGTISLIGTIAIIGKFLP
jgi:hypothetical protein